ncbi:MAG TPA: hypothetical protein VN428_13930 [Bryobacteraceae bacterium]|nr:hypothetical protein [Bryobacteraceae bacterium]
MGSEGKPHDAAEWERHKVIITAAVAVIVGNSEIKEIRPVRHANTWIRHGRMTIQGSHDVSRQRGNPRNMPDRRG